MLAANDHHDPIIDELLAAETERLKSLLAVSAGLLAHRSGHDFARHVLFDVAEALAPRPIRLRDIAAPFCAQHGLAISDLTGRSRLQPLCGLRQDFMVLGVEAGHSYAAVGRFLNRDHTTILHGVRASRKRAPK